MATLSKERTVFDRWDNGVTGLNPTVGTMYTHDFLLFTDTLGWVDVPTKQW
jgi:hypothetical protein